MSSCCFLNWDFGEHSRSNLDYVSLWFLIIRLFDTVNERYPADIVKGRFCEEDAAVPILLSKFKFLLWYY